MVLVFHALGTFSQTVDQNIETQTIYEFNAKFEEFTNKKNLTAQDIITLGNLAKEYNNSSNPGEIIVTVLNVESKYRNMHQLEEKSTYDFINQYSYDSLANNTIFFQCQSVEYNQTTGRISRVVIKKL